MSAWVNLEICEELALAIRPRDVCSQRIQNDTIQGMIAVTEAANTRDDLVRKCDGYGEDRCGCVGALWSRERRNQPKKARGSKG